MKLHIKLLTFLLLPLFAYSQDDGPDFFKVYKVKKYNILNIRKSASCKAMKIGSIPYNGTHLKNLGCVGGLTFQEFTELPKVKQKEIEKKRPRWCKIKYNKTIGWVSGKYLREN